MADTIKAGNRHSKEDRELINAAKVKARELVADMDALGADVDEQVPAILGENPVKADEAPDHFYTETLVALGDELKAVEEIGGKLRVGAYGIRFGNTQELDLTGEWFGQDTDYGPHKGDGVVSMFHHGIPVAKGLEKLAQKTFAPVKTRLDPLGLWVETVLDMADEYERHVAEMVKRGKLRWSSGAASHMVLRDEKTMQIKRWHPAEFSYTPQAAEPRLPVIVPLKALPVIEINASDNDAPKGGSTAGAPIDTEAMTNHPPIQKSIGVPTMDEKEILALIEKRESERKAAELAETERKEKEDARVKAAVEAERTRLEAEYKTANRRGSYAFHKVAERGTVDEDYKAMLYWLRTGDKVAAKAALQEDTDSEGGYLVPDGFYNRISEKLRERSVVRAAGATVVPTSLKMVEFPAENAAASVTLTAEEAAYTQSEPTIAIVQVTNYKASVVMKVSEELLADQQANLDQFLNNQILNGLATWENTYFVAGTGTAQPRGALTASGLGVTAAGTGAITSTEVVNLVYSLGDAYADNAAIVTRRATLGSLRALASANQFLFNRTPQGSGSGGGQGGINSDEVLYGMPVFQTAQIAAMATGVKSMLIGDFSRYVITENGGLTISRNPYLYQANGQVGIFATKRQGGNSLLDEAFKHLIQA